MATLLQKKESKKLFSYPQTLLRENCFCPAARRGSIREREKKVEEEESKSKPISPDPFCKFERPDTPFIARPLEAEPWIESSDYAIRF